MKALGSYRIVDQLPGGVEGARYSGREAGTDRPVILHVLRASRIEPERLTAIEHRARCLTELDAPGIAPIVELALTGMRPFVAVADRAAGDLARRLAQGTFLRPSAARLSAELIRAVRRAHQRGLFHGNLSIESVGLDAEQRPILDFMGLETSPTFGPAGASLGSLEGDIAALGKVLLVLLAPDGDPQKAAPPAEAAVLAAMLDADPFARPTIGAVVSGLMPWLDEGAPVGLDAEIVAHLEASGEISKTLGAAVPTRPPAPSPPRWAPSELRAGMALGRYRLDAQIGRGSMGEVWRATEVGTDRKVAIKAVHPSYAKDEYVLRRFRREAKLLEGIRHQNVVEIYEVNEDDGHLYLALELVEGPSLLEYRKERGRLPEREALAIVLEIARGLASAHAQGVVHRDLKPGNVLLEMKSQPTGTSALPFKVRICDFGIAKRIAGADGTELTDLTQDGAIGTPKYMSPEQCTPGAQVGPSADVYALGVTLFDLLTAEAPFNSDSTAAILYAHVHQVAPRVEVSNPELSAAVGDLVASMLQKKPADRPIDAADVILRIERALGEKPSFEHPALPGGADPDAVMLVAHRYELPASPAELWPRVSNTERLNRAIGLPPVNWSIERDDAGQSRVYGEAKQVGLSLRWREHPFEWVEGQRLGVVREYESGPLLWYVSLVELQPGPSGGTTLVHRLWLEPRNMLGKAAAWVETKQRLARRMEAVYRRIGAKTTDPKRQELADPFEIGRPVPSSRMRRMEALAHELGPSGEDRAPLLRWLAAAPDQDVARIRPKALAKVLGMPEAKVIAFCLEGASAGLLVPLWDVICPTCRIPTNIAESLEAIAAHAFCESCNVTFDVDLSRTVELIFRVHPEIRSAEVRTYCIGGPAHSPHAAVQLRLRPEERYTLRLALEPGPYELRVVGSEWRARFKVEPTGLDRGSFSLAEPAPKQRAFGAGLVSLTLEGDRISERVVRLERTAPREDALTAAEASAHPLFRRLFPDQTFKADTLIGLESITLLITDLHDPERLYRELGDPKMLGLLHQLLNSLGARIEGAGGALVKAAGHGVVAAFARADDAVKAGLEVIGEHPVLPVIAAVHRGSAMAATVNERLDYFGRSVNRAHRLLALADPGQLVLSDEVAEDPKVERLWRASHFDTDVMMLSAPGDPLEFALRLSPPRHPSRAAG